jgi:hypothetical protein
MHILAADEDSTEVSKPPRSNPSQSPSGSAAPAREAGLSYHPSPRSSRKQS